MFNRPSPYIANPKRLADLIAAIQVLGTYRFASRRIEKWEKRLGRIPVSAENWSTVFNQHPEFFAAQGSVISLVWRRSRERNYDTFTGLVISRPEAIELSQKDSEESEQRLSRSPLESTEVAKLVDIAISLHEREIRHTQERRWWVTAVIALTSVIVSYGLQTV